MPDFLVGWVILAAAGLASWFAIRAAYQRGFSDGMAEVWREIRDAEPLTEADLWPTPRMVVTYPEDERIERVECPVCGYNPGLVAAVPHG